MRRPGSGALVGRVALTFWILGGLVLGACGSSDSSPEVDNAAIAATADSTVETPLSEEETGSPDVVEEVPSTATTAADGDPSSSSDDLAVTTTAAEDSSSSVVEAVPTTEAEAPTTTTVAPTTTAIPPTTTTAAGSTSTAEASATTTTTEPTTTTTRAPTTTTTTTRAPTTTTTTTRAPRPLPRPRPRLPLRPRPRLPLPRPRPRLPRPLPRLPRPLPRLPLRSRTTVYPLPTSPWSWDRAERSRSLPNLGLSIWCFGLSGDRPVSGSCPLSMGWPPSIRIGWRSWRLLGRQTFPPPPEEPNSC